MDRSHGSLRGHGRSARRALKPADFPRSPGACGVEQRPAGALSAWQCQTAGGRDRLPICHDSLFATPANVVLPLKITGLFAALAAGTWAANTRLRMRRFIIPLVVAMLSLAGIVVTADAIVTTPGEQLDAFVDEVTAPRAEKRMDAALSYVNPSEVPCRFSGAGKLSEFGEGEGNALADALRSSLNVFDSEQQESLQKSVELRDDSATVTTRVGDNEYEQTVIYELVRREERWLVRAVRTL